MVDKIDITSKFNRNQVYTLVGKFDYENNIFNTIDNEQVKCYAYRHHSRYMQNNLVVVNIKYIEQKVNDWVIFQAVLLDDIPT